MKQEELTKHIEGPELAIIPLGGQSELGQVLWVVSYQSKMIILDAGASYPNKELPGVDLLLPNTSFLEAHQKDIEALLLTSGNEEYIGAVPYLLKNVAVPKIMAPRFISCLLEQTKSDLPLEHPLNHVKIENIETKRIYRLGPFEVEWIRVNDAVAQACALRIATPESQIIYMTTYKLDQTPVDHQLTDIARFAELGEKGVTLLIGSSAGVERVGYSESEFILYDRLYSCIKAAEGRVFVLMSGTNTYRLQTLIDIAKRCDRKILLLGEPLVHSAVASAMTGNLAYQQELEISLDDLPTLNDKQVLIVATGKEGNPMPTLTELAHGTHKFIKAKAGDTIIYSSEIPPGRLRQMAMLLDQFLLLGIKIFWGEEQGMHVPRSASQEELKLAFSLIKPKYFIPAFGEGRHIIHHAKLAQEWGMPQANVFPLQNGQIFSIAKDEAFLKGRVEYQAVLVNREHGERITTFTVNERRAMSLEGLITISLIINSDHKIVSGPQFDCSAASFRYSKQWQEACLEMTNNIVAAVETYSKDQELPQEKIDEVAIRAMVRDAAFKTLRSHLQTKPVLQIVIQQLDTVQV